MGWLAGYKYRKSHVLTQLVGAGTGYQVEIKTMAGAGADAGQTVYLNSHAQNDFDDVRFTDNDETTELDYWLERKTDGVIAYFWVELADDLGAGNVTIYVYYGNAGAASNSNGSNTFPSLFEDFAGSAEPPSGWTENNIHDNRVTWDDLSDNSKYKVYDYTDTSAYWHGNEIYKSVTTPTTFALEAKHIVVCSAVPVTTQHWSRLELWKSSVQKVWMSYQDGFVGSAGRMNSKITGTAASTAVGIGSGTYWLEIHRDGTNVKTYYNHILLQTKAETGTYDEVRFHLVGGRSNSSSDPQTELEYVFLRKLIAGDVTHGAWGSEESTAVLMRLLKGVGK